MNLTPLEAVRRYYEALVPGRRQELMDLLDPHVVLELPQGFPGSGGCYTGLKAYIEDFLYGFYGSFDVTIGPEEYIDAGDNVTVLGRMQGHAIPTGTAVDVPFAHVWKVRKSLLAHGRMFTDTAILCQAVGGAVLSRAQDHPEIG